LLDDEFADEDEDLEEKGENLEDDFGDDWIVDDNGAYGADDDERKWSKGRTEVGV
jgi:chromosome transmission fidelity protein 4